VSRILFLDGWIGLRLSLVGFCLGFSNVVFVVAFHRLGGLRLWQNQCKSRLKIGNWPNRVTAKEPWGDLIKSLDN